MAYIDDIVQVSTNDSLQWDKLQNCNILITGATGLIGSCLVDILMYRPNRNYKVYAAGRNEERAKTKFKTYLNDPAFHFIAYDVLNPLEETIDFHYIIHAASNASPNFFSTKPVEVIKSNVIGVVNLMDYGLSHNLSRFLLISSGEVYGEGDGRSFTEDYSGYVNTTNPRSSYPSSKRAAETLCIAYSAEYGIETVIACPSHTYGPGFTESDNRVYAQFIRNVLRGENIIMKSTGAQFRSLCYVVDCASAILYILLSGENRQAYNIADANSNITIRQLAQLIAEIGGKKVLEELSSEQEKQGYNIVSKSIFSTEKINKLGWYPKDSIFENMKKTIEYLQNNMNDTETVL